MPTSKPRHQFGARTCTVTEIHIRTHFGVCSGCTWAGPYLRVRAIFILGGNFMGLNPQCHDGKPGIHAFGQVRSDMSPED